MLGLFFEQNRLSSGPPPQEGNPSREPPSRDCSELGRADINPAMLATAVADREGEESKHQEAAGSDRDECKKLRSFI